MDKFVVKMPAVSSTKKASSHLLPNLTDLTAHDQAIKYPECTFHVDDGLMFCSLCNIVKKSSRDSKSPLWFSTTVYREKDSIVMFKLVLLYNTMEIRCEFNRLAVWYKLTCVYWWGFKIIQDALKIIFYNVVYILYKSCISLWSAWLVMDWLILLWRSLDEVLKN